MRSTTLLYCILVLPILLYCNSALSQIEPQNANSNLNKLIEQLELDHQMQQIIASGEDKYYKVFIPDQSENQSTFMRYWRGLLIIPNLSQKSQLLNLRNDQDEADNWWYQNEDRSFSKYLGNSQNRVLGIVSIDNDRNLLLAYDLDGDRIIDVLYMKSEDKELLVLDEDAGSDFFDSSEEFRERLCDEEPGPGSSLEDVVGSGAVFNICSGGYGSSEEGGLGGIGISPGTAGSGIDILETLCGHFSPGSVIDIGFGITSDETITERYIRGLRRLVNSGYDGEVDSFPVRLGRVTIWWFAPGIDSAVKIGLQVVIAADILNQLGLLQEQIKKLKEILDQLLPQAGSQSTDGDSDNQEDTEQEDGEQEDGEHEGGGDGGEEAEPVEGGEETQPGCISGDPNCERGNEALRELCERINADNDFLDSIEDAEDQAAADTNCDDPVVNPNPAEDSGDTEINCHPGRGRGVNTNTMEDLLSVGSQGDECGPTEIPGPDGECNGLGSSFQGSGVRGSVWTAYSEIIGIDFCNDFVCDDFQ